MTVEEAKENVFGGKMSRFRRNSVTATRPFCVWIAQRWRRLTVSECPYYFQQGGGGESCHIQPSNQFSLARYS